jgi:hypothetical protein
MEDFPEELEEIVIVDFDPAPVDEETRQTQADAADAPELNNQDGHLDDVDGVVADIDRRPSVREAVEPGPEETDEPRVAIERPASERSAEAIEDEPPVSELAGNQPVPAEAADQETRDVDTQLVQPSADTPRQESVVRPEADTDPRDHTADEQPDVDDTGEVDEGTWTTGPVGTEAPRSAPRDEFREPRAAESQFGGDRPRSDEDSDDHDEAPDDATADSEPADDAQDTAPEPPQDNPIFDANPDFFQSFQELQTLLRPSGPASRVADRSPIVPDDSFVPEPEEKTKQLPEAAPAKAPERPKRSAAPDKVRDKEAPPQPQTPKDEAPASVSNPEDLDVDAALAALDAALAEANAAPPDYGELRPLPLAGVVPESQTAAATAGDGSESEAYLGLMVDEVLSRETAADRIGVPPLPLSRELRQGVDGMLDAAWKSEAARGVDASTRIIDPSSVLVYSPDEWAQVAAAASVETGEDVDVLRNQPFVVLPDGTILVRNGEDSPIVLSGIQNSVVRSLAARAYAPRLPGGGFDAASPHSPLRLVRNGYEVVDTAVVGPGEYGTFNGVVATQMTEQVIREQWGVDTETYLGQHAEAALATLDTPEKRVGDYVIETITDERQAQSPDLTREAVRDEVQHMIETGRLTGKTAIVDSLVRQTFGTAGAVDIVSGWGVEGGYTTTQVQTQLEILREQKLAADQAARERARDATDAAEAEAAIAGLHAVIKSTTGDLRSEGGADVLAVGLAQDTTSASGPMPSGSGPAPTTAPATQNSAQGQSGEEDKSGVLQPDELSEGAGSARSDTRDNEGVHQPILDNAAVERYDPEAARADEHQEETGGSAAASLFAGPRQHLNPGTYARTVRATARELGFTARDMRRIAEAQAASGESPTESIEKAVQAEIDRRLGAAALGIGSNRAIVTLSTGTDTIQVERPALIVDARQLIRMAERHKDNPKGPDIIARIVLNTIIRSEQGIYLERPEGGVMSKAYAQTGKGPKPVILAPGPVRPGTSARHARQGHASRVQHAQSRSHGTPRDGNSGARGARNHNPTQPTRSHPPENTVRLETKSFEHYERQLPRSRFNRLVTTLRGGQRNRTTMPQHPPRKGNRPHWLNRRPSTKTK